MITLFFPRFLAVVSWTGKEGDTRLAPQTRVLQGVWEMGQWGKRYELVQDQKPGCLFFFGH